MSKPPCIACSAEKGMLPPNASVGDVVAAGLGFAAALPFIVLCPAHATVRDRVAEVTAHTVPAALHAALDKALAAYLKAYPDKRPSTATMLDVLQWSHANLTEKDRAALGERRQGDPR